MVGMKYSEILSDLARIKHDRLPDLIQVVSSLQQEDARDISLRYVQVVYAALPELSGQTVKTRDLTSVEIARLVKCAMLIRPDQSSKFLATLSKPSAPTKPYYLQGVILGLLQAVEILHLPGRTWTLEFEQQFADTLVRQIFSFERDDQQLDSDIQGELTNVVSKYYGKSDPDVIDFYRERQAAILKALNTAVNVQEESQAHQRSDCVLMWWEVPATAHIVKLIRYKISDTIPFSILTAKLQEGIKLAAEQVHGRRKK